MEKEKRQIRREITFEQFPALIKNVSNYVVSRDGNQILYT